MVDGHVRIAAERLAHDHHKRFKLQMTGFGEIPAPYLATIKDCVIQMLRNAAVHGIEPSDVRKAQTKGDVGVVRADFRRAGEGYELVFEDDGAGISPDILKSAAVRKQLITEAEAAGLDTRATMALIFRPGFSTQEEVSLDAGRGVGMDVVARAVYALGGKIGVSTNPGKFTRFKIVLPAVDTCADGRGLPRGIQIVGRKSEDPQLCAIAAWLCIAEPNFQAKDHSHDPTQRVGRDGA